jgi:opacity protein-like surface antigen
MKTRIFWKALVLVAAFIVVADITHAQGSSGINRVEFFGGYSHNRVDTALESDEFDEDFGRRVGANGVNFSVTGNFTKYVGAKFDYAHHRKTDDFTFDAFDVTTKYQIDTIMGGIQVKNNKKDGPRVKPFFHALAGVARQKLSASESGGEVEFSVSQSNFTFAVGGGVDVRVSKHVDIRVFQIDYNPTYIKDSEIEDVEINGKPQHNFRFGFGIVIH